MRQTPALALFVIVAGCLLVACGCSRREGRSELRCGGFIEAEQIRVGSKLGGRVARVLVEEGEEVETGQVLVGFETGEIEAQLAESHADLERARAQLAQLVAGSREEEIQQASARVERLREKVGMLRRGPRDQEIEQARLLVERSRAEYANAQATFDRLQSLAERNAAARETLDAARTSLEVMLRAMEVNEQRLEMLREGNRPEEIAMAAHELEEAQAALDLARKGPRSQEIEQAEAALDAAQARIRRLEIQLDEGTVRAPLPSFVEAIDLQPGDLVAPGAPLANLVRKDQLWVRAFVPETDLGIVSNRQAVVVTIDSFPDLRFEGSVLRVNRVAEFTPRNVQTYRERQDMMFGMKVRVTDPEGLLRPGMAATVHIPRAP